MSLQKIRDRLERFEQRCLKGEDRLNELTEIRKDLERTLDVMRSFASHYDLMEKACLDATVLLSDPDFNKDTQDDLLSQMREVYKTGRKLEKPAAG